MGHKSVVSSYMISIGILRADDEYKTNVNIVQNHKTPIPFDELHEKLINQELELKHL